ALSTTHEKPGAAAVPTRFRLPPMNSGSPSRYSWRVSLTPARAGTHRGATVSAGRLTTECSDSRVLGPGAGERVVWESTYQRGYEGRFIEPKLPVSGGRPALRWFDNRFRICGWGCGLSEETDRN